MRLRIAFAAALAAVFPWTASGEEPTGEYPTHEVVRYVHECMVDHGGGSWGNLYSCSCKFDAIAAELRYEEFVAADTAKRGRRLGGERGGVLRETEMAEELRDGFEGLESRAERRCFISAGAGPGENGSSGTD